MEDITADSATGQTDEQPTKQKTEKMDDDAPIENKLELKKALKCSQSILIIEKPTLDIAYDLLNQNFKATEKQIMKELQTVTSSYAKICKQKSLKSTDAETMKQKIHV